MKTLTQRQLQVGEKIRHVLAGLFMRGDFYDPNTFKLINITITEVRISADLRNATVFISPFQIKEKEYIIKLLESLSGQIRKIISPQLDMRHSPELTFRLDKSFEQSNHIEEILNRPEVKRDLVNK